MVFTAVDVVRVVEPLGREVDDDGRTDVFVLLVEQLLDDVDDIETTDGQKVYSISESKINKYMKNLLSKISTTPNSVSLRETFKSSFDGVSILISQPKFFILSMILSTFILISPMKTAICWIGKPGRAFWKPPLRLPKAPSRMVPILTR